MCCAPFPFIILLVLLIPFSRFVVGTSIGPKAAAVALSFAVIPYFARMVEQNLRDVPRGMIDMALACGASPLTCDLQGTGHGGTARPAGQPDRHRHRLHRLFGGGRRGRRRRPGRPGHPLRLLPLRDRR
jgi:hypothetical protein